MSNYQKKIDKFLNKLKTNINSNTKELRITREESKEIYAIISHIVQENIEIKTKYYDIINTYNNNEGNDDGKT